MIRTRLLLRILFLFIVLLATAWLFVTSRFFLSGVVFCLSGFLVYSLYHLNLRAKKELEHFVESIHYRDFTRNFDVHHAAPELRPFREGFNAINSAFKSVVREKEVQYQYMHKILELIDTGIICYEEKEGAIILLNETLKNLLGIPYLKTLHDLKGRDEDLFDTILSLRPGKNKVVSIKIDKAETKVFLTSTLFKTEGKTYKLVAFQNVNEALDENEGAAWHKLLSVMTHEIMNSVTPISSLAETLRNRLQNAEKTDGNYPSALIQDIELGIDTIKHRSESLIRFAHTYRNLNKITTPDLQKVIVRDLFERLDQLMHPLFEQKKIESEFILSDPGILFMADSSLVEQILINLITNSINAVKGKTNPKITISASEKNKNKVILKITDNGIGIPSQNLDKIFIPFFSTTKGSGIGLSLCKQIMLVHNGSIRIQSIEGEGTSAWLEF